MPPTEALARAIKDADGQAALASKIGTKQQNVSYWLKHSQRGVPAEFVLAIEAVTSVTRHDLRPDLYPAERGGAQARLGAPDDGLRPAT